MREIRSAESAGQRRALLSPAAGLVAQQRVEPAVREARPPEIDRTPAHIEESGGVPRRMTGGKEQHDAAAQDDAVRETRRPCRAFHVGAMRAEHERTQAEIRPI